MSAAHTYALKTLLRAFGLNPDELEQQALRLSEVVMKTKPEDIQDALNSLLDYKRDQEQNKRRLSLIMEKLGIDETATEREDNGQDFI